MLFEGIFVGYTYNKRFLFHKEIGYVHDGLLYMVLTYLCYYCQVLNSRLIFLNRLRNSTLLLIIALVYLTIDRKILLLKMLILFK